MNVQAIVVQDLTNPIEVQMWLANNSMVQIFYILVNQSTFYIFYK